MIDLSLAPAKSSEVILQAVSSAHSDGFGGLLSSHQQTALSSDGFHLLVSPYDEEDHLLDLRTLDISNQIVAKALVGMRCLKCDYATSPYVDIFNWAQIVNGVQEIAAELGYLWKERSFYVVVFRSRIPPFTAYSDLGALDKAAHAEATKSGGFLKYWFGSPDEAGRNLATCIWRSHYDAKVGSVGEAHRRAAGSARKLYTEWKIEQLQLIIKDDAKEWEIAPWVA